MRSATAASLAVAEPGESWPPVTVGGRDGQRIKLKLSAVGACLSTRQTRGQKRLKVSEVAADWNGLMIEWRHIMRPSVALCGPSGWSCVVVASHGGWS